jgi:hypothetical protein
MGQDFAKPRAAVNAKIRVAIATLPVILLAAMDSAFLPRAEKPPANRGLMIPG